MRGVVAALVTPLRPGGGIDVAGVERLVERAVAGGVHAILTAGEPGEYMHLSRGERLLVARVAIAAACGRVPVYAGVGAASTEEAIALARDAAGAGVAAAALAMPPYFALPQDALARHVAEVAAGGGLPLLVVNEPRGAGGDLHPATLARLAGLEGVAALVQADPDIARLAATIRLVGDRPVLAGRDAQGYAALRAGARGVVSAAAGVLPRRVVAIHDAVLAGDDARAAALHAEILPFFRLLGAAPGIAAPAKAALALLGLPGGPVRRPLPDLTGEEMRDLRAALAGLGMV
ncbi:MAG TPA: dihydrodipicolinate synthase family protein [Thermomicrobiales bacterium]|nr:dihydrodipicolinate synthase family protein [Thermomicrobiales bacterium]